MSARRAGLEGEMKIRCLGRGERGGGGVRVGVGVGVVLRLMCGAALFWLTDFL